MAIFPYRTLNPTAAGAQYFHQWIDRLDQQFADITDYDGRSEIVRDELWELFGSQAGSADAPVFGSALDLSFDPRNITLEPEYYGDIDADLYRQRKPLIYLWQMFDRSPLGLNHWLGFRLRAMLGKHIFQHIGSNVKIFHNVEFSFGYNLVIEDDCVIHKNVLLDDRGGIILRRGTSVSDYANIYSHTHDIHIQADVTNKLTEIGPYARITYHATVLAGSRIGEDAMLGAMGVATKPVEAHHVKVGIPAKTARIKDHGRSASISNERAQTTRPLAESVLELVGNTPMLHLRHLSPPGGASVYAKLETFNPGASIKDRVALGLVLDAERRGLLQPGGIIVEATAGNTGIGLALVGVSRGYSVHLFVPNGFSEEKSSLMRALGATVIRTPESEGMSGAMVRAHSFAASVSNAWLAAQFENLENPEVHYASTGPEIFEQAGRRIDTFVAGVGSGGTFSGVSKFLKNQDSKTVAIAVETEGSVLQGGTPGRHRVEGIGVSFVPDTFDRNVCDEIIRVSDSDAFATVKRLAAEEGVLAGSSSGANVYAAIQVAAKLRPGQIVVTIVADSAERYLSKDIFEEAAQCNALLSYEHSLHEPVSA